MEKIKIEKPIELKCEDYKENLCPSICAFTRNNGISGCYSNLDWERWKKEYIYNIKKKSFIFKCIYTEKYITIKVIDFEYLLKQIIEEKNEN